MNQGRPKSNAHFHNEHRLNAQPDRSTQISHYDSYNFALTKERDLARYKTAYSSKLNIYDQTRVVEPRNYYGIRFIEGNDKTQRYATAGMNGENSRHSNPFSFTKPAPRMYPQNL